MVRVRVVVGVYMMARNMGRRKVGLMRKSEVVSMDYRMVGRVVGVYEVVRGRDLITMDLSEEAEVSKANRKRELKML